MNINKIIATVVFTIPLVAIASTDAPPKSKQTELALYLSATEAYELKRSQEDKVLLIDIRTREEAAYVGMPQIADANIPYLKTDYGTWDENRNRFRMLPNAEFEMSLVELLDSRHLDSDAAIILMCRSGKRSANAVNFLSQLGYLNVYTVVDGFEGDIADKGPTEGRRLLNGWKNAGLPWSYKTTKDKFFPDYD